MKIFLKNDLVFFLFFILAKIILHNKVAIALKKTKYDVVHVQDLNAFNAVYSICLKQKIKLVFTIHGHIYEGNNATRSIVKDSWLWKKLYTQEYRAIRSADNIIVVSTHSLHLVQDIKKMQSANIYLKNNFINTTEFCPVSQDVKYNLREKYNFKKEDFIVLSSGRLSRTKGLKFVVSAMLLLNEYPNVKLFVVGDGIEKKALKHYVESNHLKHKVIFQSEVSREELIGIYQLSDVFIIASVTNEGPIEGTPIALLEAMACNLPAITTTTGGLKDIVDMVGTELAVNEQDDVSIANMIKLLYDDKTLIEKMSVISLELVQRRLSAETGIRELLVIYKKG